MINLKELTAEGLIAYLQEEISTDDYKDFLERFLSETNFIEYADALESIELTPKEVPPSTEDETSVDPNAYLTDEQSLYGMLKLFLLYEEVLTAKQISEMKASMTEEELNNLILRIAFTELHFFNNTRGLELPYKEFVRDYMYKIYYADITMNGYKDIDNVEEELSSISNYYSLPSWATGKYIVRFLDTYPGSGDRKFKADCEDSMALASARLNSNSDHINYIKNLAANQTKDIIWFDGSTKTVTSLSSAEKQTYFFGGQVASTVLDSDSDSFKKLADFIYSKTINYKL